VEAPEQRRITAYGLDRSAISWVLRPERAADVAEAIGFARTRGLRVCPAGGHNSFGDVFLLGDHVSLDMTRLDRILSLDEAARTITVEAGVLERDVLARVMPLGFQLAAASGSLWNTVGGSLSSNINGKDAWKVGTFGDQVQSFRIVLADGTTREVDRERDGPLFEAVVGGLGLLGVVTEVTLRLRPIPSTLVEVRTRAAPGVEELLAHFAQLSPENADFSYAWLDAYPHGRAFGRAVCETARFVPSTADPSTADIGRELLPPERILLLPPEIFWGVVRRGWRLLFRVGLEGAAFRAMNAVKYLRRHSAGERTTRVSFPTYQYPMAKLLPHWNLKFAPEGFNEVQALFPSERFEDALRTVLAYCRRHGRTPEVSAVRRHRADRYPLSFAGEGLSVTLPLPLAGFTPGGLDAYRRDLVEAILAFGGKVYLSKFPYLEREAFREMYPAYRRFLDVKGRVDPERCFWSEAAERLLG
jgi:decaprenylphospho-beta-D-ribofuranose 2-oxidase